MSHDGVTIKRESAAEILRRIGASPKHLAIGVIGQKAHEQHVEDNGKTGPLTVAAVAALNHFGVEPHLPSRPFLTIALEKHRDEIAQTQARIAAQLVKGRLTYEQALGLLGAEIVAQIKKTITEHVPPENAQSTIDRKGSSTPLINHGQLLGAVTFEIREGR